MKSSKLAGFSKVSVAGNLVDGILTEANMAISVQNVYFTPRFLEYMP